ncbi:MAG: hypothetical protein ACK44W_09740, partial [Planctomycetota bacterium]
EFLNRIDEIVVFHSLSQEHLRKIVDLQLEQVRRRLSERRIQLDVTPEVREALAREGYDPQYGARPLRRLVQRKIQNALASQLLEGRFQEGDRILVELDAKGEFRFVRQDGAARAA